MPVTYGEIVRESDWDETAGVEGFVYIRAATTIHITFEGDTGILQRIRSPGLWHVSDDESEEYYAEVFEEERATLLLMLDELGATPE